MKKGMVQKRSSRSKVQIASNLLNSLNVLNGLNRLNEKPVKKNLPSASCKCFPLMIGGA